MVTLEKSKGYEPLEEIENRKITLEEIVSSMEGIEKHRKDWLAIEQFHDASRPKAVVDPDMFGEDGTRYISQTLVSMVNELLRMVASDQIVEEAHEVVLELDRFRSAWIEWAAAVAQKSDSDRSDFLSRPDAPVAWPHWERAMLSLIPKKYALPEGIDALLSEPEIRHNQIADIYGWVKEDGSPNVDMVKEEIRNPGTHYDPKNWVSPEVNRRKKKIAKLWSDRIVLDIDPRHFSADPVVRNRSFAEPEVAAEPIHLLLQMEGMTVEQVASMKQISVEDVRIIQQSLGRANDYDSAIAIDPTLANDSAAKVMSASELQARIDANVPTPKPKKRPSTNLADAVIVELEADPNITPAEISAKLIPSNVSATVEFVSHIVDSYHQVLDKSAELLEAEKSNSADSKSGDYDPEAAISLAMMKHSIEDLGDHLGNLNREGLVKFANHVGAIPVGAIPSEMDLKKATKRDITRMIVSLKKV